MRKYPAAKDFDAIAGTLPSNARGDGGNIAIIVPQQNTDKQGSRGVSVTAITLLVLTALISLLWSHYKLLDQDEIFVLQTDSVHTLRELVHIQLHYTISLDPLVYHALAHWSTCLFGANAFALRLPSLLGFLLMQVCLYVFVRRCFTTHNAALQQAETAALIALAFPAITATLFYSAEARPYGLLLGFTALMLVAWQECVILSEAERSRRTPKNLVPPQRSNHSGDEAASMVAHNPRTFELITLTAAIAIALNTHYFAILLLIPLCLAELVRTIKRRKLDIPVAVAILTGIATEAFTLPFQHAAAAFRLHYYNVDTLGPRAITQSYRALFVDYTHTAITTQHIAAALFVLLAFALVIAVAYRRTTHTLALTTSEFTFVTTLAALPFFGFLLGYFVTHTLEVRYVLGAIIGISILFALTLPPRSATLDAQRVVAVLVLALIMSGITRVRIEQRRTAQTLVAMRPSREVVAALEADPAAPLYIQEMGHFETLSYYEPDLEVRKRLTLVYSPTRELQYDHHDTEALTAQHMTQFTALPIARYVDISHQSGEHLFLQYNGGWNWTAQAFAADRATVTPLGSTMEGEAASVRFR